MAPNRAWSSYAPDYRAAEVAAVAGWIAAGQSGAVVGAGGAGKSNFLGFLCHRPEVVAARLPAAGPVALVWVDLNALPGTTLDVFYRVLLRALHEARAQLPADLAQAASAGFRAHLATTDPFVVQTALRELLLDCRAAGIATVLVLDRFDKFLGVATPELMDSLRALRDSFKGSLSLIVGMRQAIAYLADPGLLGELYEVLDTQVCWVGPMAEADARRMIAEEIGAGAGAANAGNGAAEAGAEAAAAPLDAAAAARLIASTGGYPALLKVAAHWWRDGGRQLPADEWDAALRALPGVRVRLAEVWDGMTQAEQAALSDLAALSARRAQLLARAESDAAVRTLAEKAGKDFELHHKAVLADLGVKGLAWRVGDDWSVRGTLLALHAAEHAGRGRGAIWHDAESGAFYQGRNRLPDLANLERRLLAFLLAHPRKQHTKTAAIEAVWPDDVVAEGVMDDALYQVVKELRRKIEPDSAAPRYLITWRGRPEGGYQLFPEGRPGGG